MNTSPVKLEGSNVLVTGGCGFIGSHLVRRLVEQSVENITVIDSLKYGDRANIGSQSWNIKIIKHTIDNKSGSILHDALRGVDYVFHLAAEKHKQSINKPEDVINRNINGTFKLYEAAAASGIKKIIFSSSLYAYGRMTAPALKETDMPVPATVYGITKLVGEQFLAHIMQKYGVAYNVLRIFFTYGPRQFSGTGYKSVVVKNFERILRNENPVVNGDGKQVLDYLYIDDVITAMISAMESHHAGEILNVGSSVPTSINELTDMMIKVSGRSLEKLYAPPDVTKDTYRVADTSKIKKLLHFHPAVSLEDGLRKTYHWIQERENA